MIWGVLGTIGFSLMLTASIIRMEPSSERVIGVMALVGCLLCTAALFGGMLHGLMHE